MSDTANETGEQPLDVVVVGAGFAGLRALHRLREGGYAVRMLEAGSGIGGTWYWNRYPGARVDLESMEYSYGFSDALQQEWRWPERYSGQKDVLAYLEWVADKLDLRRDIQLDTRLTDAVFDEARSLWVLTSDGGEHLEARYLVMAIGFLSATFMPDIPGIDRFAGELVHTGKWPDGLALDGRKVGVIGAGATGVQLVPRIAESAGHLTVFQRTANWCMPIVNEPMRPDYEAFVKANYARIRQLELDSPGAGIVLFNYDIVVPTGQPSGELTPRQREREFEHRWTNGAVHMGTRFSDLIVNREANENLRAFWERKIREQVADAAIADKLVPDHAPLTRRPCGENGYYKAFNRDNVTLVATLDDPIAEITATGVRLASGAEHELDVLIFATGFDPGVGPMLRMNVRGRNGVAIGDKWKDGPVTLLGMMIDAFPNLFLLNGPQSPAAFFSPPLLANYQADVVLRLARAADEIGDGEVEPTAASVDAWDEAVSSAIRGTLMEQSSGWWMGGNVPGRRRKVVAYAGGFPPYRAAAEKSLADFQDFAFGRCGQQDHRDRSPSLP